MTEAALRQPFDRTTDDQDGERDPEGEKRGAPEARPARDPEAGDDPDGSGGREAMDRPTAVVAEDDAPSQEADAGDDPLGDARDGRGVEAHAVEADLEARDGEECTAERHERVSPDPGRTLVEPAVQTKGAPDQGGDRQAKRHLPRAAHERDRVHRLSRFAPHRAAPDRAPADEA